MNQEKIGHFIALNRKQNNMTQRQLSLKLGITDRAVSKWENGKCMPDIAILSDLATILHVSVEEILAGEKSEIESEKEKYSLHTAFDIFYNIGKKWLTALLEIFKTPYTLVFLGEMAIFGIFSNYIIHDVSWQTVLFNSVFYAWFSIFVFTKISPKKTKTALTILSVAIIPVLSILTIIYKEKRILELGLSILLIGVSYLWTSRHILHHFENTNNAIATCLLLAIPLTICANLSISLILKEQCFDFWDTLSINLELLTGTTLLLIEKYKKILSKR